MSGWEMDEFMTKKYSKLLSPLIVGKQVVKSRFYFPNAMPKVLQGGQTFPDEPIVSFYTELAKNGAAMICCSDFSNRSEGFNENERHFPFYDHNNPGTENALSMLADNVHFYGSLLGTDIGMGDGPDAFPYDVVESKGDDAPDEELLDGTVHIKMVRTPKKKMEREHMNIMIDSFVEKALYYKRLGFDFVYIQPFSGTLGNFLNEKTNTRTDEYNGSLKNRMRFPLELFMRVKSAVGDDFILVLDANNHLDPALAAPYTYICAEDAIAFFLAVEPYIDMIDMRSKQIETPFEGSPEIYLHPESLALSAQTKAAGFQKPIAAWTGYMDLDLMEEAIESGKADMLCSARVMLSNSNFGEIIRSGQKEDIVPCVKCNKCHGHTMTGPWISICTVNPEIGLQHRKEKLVNPSGQLKKVAVIGGGPAGIMAAVYASRRGHNVTLFETKAEVGGQLIAASQASFKWPLKMYLDYLKSQTRRGNFQVLCNTTATPDFIRELEFDTVIVAIGGVEKLPSVEITSDALVTTPINVYGNEETIGESVICIGGSEASVETGLHLAELGRKVTVLTRSNRLAHDSNPIHYATELRDACAANPNFSFINFATTRKIGKGYVVYNDIQGAEIKLSADSIVATGGLMSQQEQALDFSSAANEIYIIGDCRKPGNVQECVRQAYAAAMQL